MIPNSLGCIDTHTFIPQANQARADLALLNQNEPIPPDHVEYTQTLNELALPVSSSRRVALRLGSGAQQMVRDALNALQGPPLSAAAIVNLFCVGAPAEKLYALLSLAGCGLIDLTRLDAEAPGLPVTSMAHLVAEGGEEHLGGHHGLSLAARFAAMDAAGIDINGRDELGMTPLHRAALHNHPATLEALIDAGADRFAVLDAGLNALHLAAQTNGNLAALIAAGLDINSRDDYGRTPLHHAVEYAQQDAISILLANGAKVDAINELGSTPLQVAASEGDVRTLALLKAAGGRVDARNIRRDTPLHWAALYGHGEAGRLLLDWGAEPLACNVEGQTPLMLSAAGGNVPLFEDLLSAAIAQNINHLHKGRIPERPIFDQLTQSLLNAADHLGNTALHWAADTSQDGILKLLQNLGADVTARNHDGQSALHVAPRQKNAESTGEPFTPARLDPWKKGYETPSTQPTDSSAR